MQPVRTGPRVLVVPCYNEERRLDAQALIAFARSGRATLLLVDDGSTDGTAGVLRAIGEAVPDRVRILSLDTNRGKAEAVRLGLRAALDEGASVVGYADADLSTPLDEVSRLFEFIESGAASVTIGSRVARLGARIERRPVRHYLGRLFATGASLVLGVAVYDTQCGAKCFGRTAALRAALESPFLSRWAFDVELLGRLLMGGPGVRGLDVARFLEVPLGRWRDVAGSKLKAQAMAGALVDLVRIWRDLRARRSAGRSAGAQETGAPTASGPGHASSRAAPRPAEHRPADRNGA